MRCRAGRGRRPRRGPCRCRRRRRSAPRRCPPRRSTATSPASPRRAEQPVPLGADVDGEQPGALEQRAGGARDDQPAAVEHHDVVAHLLHVVEEVGGEQHRDAEGPPRRATRASISSRPIGSRPAVGSSRSTSSGSATMAWASLVRWRMPVEKPATGRKRASSRPTRSSTSDARWRAARGGRPLSSPKVADDVGGRLVEGQAVVLGHVAQPAADADGVRGHVDAAHLEPARRWGG